MYIAAGKKRLEEFRAGEVKAAYDKAQQSGLPEDAQAAKDLRHADATTPRPPSSGGRGVAWSACVDQFFCCLAM